MTTPCFFTGGELWTNTHPFNMTGQVVLGTTAHSRIKIIRTPGKKKKTPTKWEKMKIKTNEQNIQKNERNYNSFINSRNVSLYIHIIVLSFDRPITIHPQTKPHTKSKTQTKSTKKAKQKTPRTSKTKKHQKEAWQLEPKGLQVKVSHPPGGGVSIILPPPLRPPIPSHLKSEAPSRQKCLNITPLPAYVCRHTDTAIFCTY